jgi:hypothetical protein
VSIESFRNGLSPGDKDLARCVRGERIVQLDRRTRELRDEAGVRRKFGVGPGSIPDWLALVGDSADGYTGLPGWGARSAATVLALATLRVDAPLCASVDALRWTGPRPEFAAWSARLGPPSLDERATLLAAARA